MATYHISHYRKYKSIINHFLKKYDRYTPDQITGIVSMYTSVPVLVIAKLMVEMGIDTPQFQKHVNSLERFYSHYIIKE